ncbi:hypothetical protein AB6N24_09925 [Cellulomonas sp. 179-A 4D5 NHS]|uniref:hypothetical protein n=1 Tax=Cellulomonas sp. 179-A 4D5 NHS TaxID=3142378 RepID=UPI0039A0B00F
MTENNPAPSLDEPDPIAQAIDALTRVANRTRTIGPGTPSAHEEPEDFAGVLVGVLTSVAANVGGVESLLAGRPGSWEAAGVRELLAGAAADDADLWRHRTEPVRVLLDVWGTFGDFGVTALFYAEQNAAAERLDADGLSEAEASEAERVYDAFEDLLAHDATAYAAAFRATVHEVAAEMGVTAPVEVVELDFSGPAPETDALGDALATAATLRTPLPATGQAPDWTDGTPADAIRRAGATYTARAQTPGQ